MLVTVYQLTQLATKCSSSCFFCSTLYFFSLLLPLSQLLSDVLLRSQLFWDWVDICVGLLLCKVSRGSSGICAQFGLVVQIRT